MEDDSLWITDPLPNNAVNATRKHTTDHFGSYVQMFHAGYNSESNTINSKTELSLYYLLLGILLSHQN